MALEREQQFYDEKKADLLQHHEGKFVLIAGARLLGAFDRPEDAYRAGLERLGNVPMFIKLVQLDEPPASMPAITLGLIGAHH